VKESEIQTKITEALIRMPDIAFYTINSTGKVRSRAGRITIGKWFSREIKSHDGLSDITGMKIDGTFFAIEVKQPGKEPTEDQWNFIHYVKDHNGLAGYATNVEDAEFILRGYEIKI